MEGADLRRTGAPGFRSGAEGFSRHRKIPTLELLAMEAPHIQAVDADFDGCAGGELMLTLREFDSSSWDVRTADTWVLSEARVHD
ncbi:hypothetical protein OHA91_38260 [Streptomyces erythrochromogenes]|uniref:Uncharacterized protein n=1 Tax=Streptomyces erythrochromogenes TaxID=285574 RepID=A0ABZ1QMD1_9ACTN|nr:hypothetical protein [Streptomyces erythrochromogenes]MCX5588751.1 hypothetical protein [Streptomyces erythrochromogenes]